MNLYKVKYTQESEAFVKAESEAEALEFITELTENGGGDKYGNTHKTNWTYYAEGDYGLFYDA